MFAVPSGGLARGCRGNNGFPGTPIARRQVIAVPSSRNIHPMNGKE
jgi:hypothetical protein